VPGESSSDPHPVSVTAMAAAMTTQLRLLIISFLS
jgi:hypothetical protein